ncbi:hypothetical protein EJ03DRAFT_297470 [Teratosphaeria nubilosa]|uniref:Heme haloperoxidase family profile domain-containing protein n=1 Tax=Teratosphaeria nubilosa TaxID=161662 RepID=A0A6G1L205_9PEZI|nr:hypothetical protein EJ03DRAFT_297470 [Teratosphaeria nubilosa]
MYAHALLLAAAAGLAVAQRPTNTSICDYYTTALFTDNTAKNQYALLTALVNRAGTGNQTTSTKVNGIVVPGEYNGTAVNLLPYFDAELKSTNRNNMPACVNFLDGGSNQNTLFAHLYQYFGALLGCSAYGTADFPAYQGNPNMYEVHKFMYLNAYQVEYFIEQVGLSAKSFGVADSDVTAVGQSLTSAFNYRDSAPVALLPGAPVQPQAICIDPSCPLAANPDYSAYETPYPPTYCNATTNGTSTMAGSTATSGSYATMNGTMTMASATGTAVASQTTSGVPAYTGAADRTTVSAAVLILGALAALL